MEEREKPAETTPADPVTQPRRAYAAPRIVWREPYEPVSFGVSCIRQPGNPPCNAGPVTA